jgi:hypothetical protein
MDLDEDEWREIVYALLLNEEWHWSSDHKRAAKMKALRIKIEEAMPVLATIWR